MPAPDEASVAAATANARREWREASAAWRRWHDHFVRQTAEATRALLDAADLRPGLRVLDLAGGTGEPAIPLSRAVAPGGRVVATDLAPEMLRVADDVARAASADNLALHAADARRLPYRAGAFDRVTCRFGLSYFPDPAAVLREALRVLRPGGRLVAVTWGAEADNPMHLHTSGVLRRYLPDPPPPFHDPAADPASLAHLLTATGFAGVDTSVEPILCPWPGSLAEFWANRLEFVPPIRRLVDRLPADRREAAVADVLNHLARYRDGDTLVFPATVVVASARRPEEPAG